MIVDSLFINSASTLDEICSPIKKLGINFFVYLKNFNDGSQINFSNDSLWIENYYKLKLYKNSLFENHPCTYRTGILLWHHINYFQFVKYQQKNHSNRANGITIIESKSHGCEFFSFFGSVKDHWLINFYINNLSIFKKFIIYFKYVFNDSLKKAEQNKIIIPRSWGPIMFKEQQTLYKMQDKISESEKIIDERLSKSVAYYRLSKREKEIIKQLECAKTSKEIGKFLGISYRTVEKHLENIKLKFNCNSKAKIITNIGLIDSKDFIHY